MPYSLHASFAELRAFVARLRPRAIRGIVKGSAAAAAPGGSRAKAAPGGRVGASCLDPAVHFADLLSGGSGGGNSGEGGSSGGGIGCSAAAAVSAVTTAGLTAAAAAGGARFSNWQVRGACQSRLCTEGRFQIGNAGEEMACSGLASHVVSTKWLCTAIANVRSAALRCRTYDRTSIPSAMQQGLLQHSNVARGRQRRRAATGAGGGVRLRIPVPSQGCIQRDGGSENACTPAPAAACEQPPCGEAATATAAENVPAAAGAAEQLAAACASPAEVTPLAEIAPPAVAAAASAAATKRPAAGGAGAVDASAAGRPTFRPTVKRRLPACFLQPVCQVSENASLNRSASHTPATVWLSNLVMNIQTADPIDKTHNVRRWL